MLRNFGLEEAYEEAYKAGARVLPPLSPASRSLPGIEIQFGDVVKTHFRTPNSSIEELQAIVAALRRWDEGKTLVLLIHIQPRTTRKGRFIAVEWVELRHVEKIASAEMAEMITHSNPLIREFSKLVHDSKEFPIVENYKSRGKKQLRFDRV